MRESWDSRGGLHLTPEIRRLVHVDLPPRGQGHDDVLLQLQILVLLDQRVLGRTSDLVVHGHLDLVKEGLVKHWGSVRDTVFGKTTVGSLQ